MSDDFFPVTRQEVVAELEREIGMREQVYPKLIARGRLKPDRAERQMRLMRVAKARIMAVDPWFLSQNVPEAIAALDRIMDITGPLFDVDQRYQEIHSLAFGLAQAVRKARDEKPVEPVIPQPKPVRDG